MHVPHESVVCWHLSCPLAAHEEFHFHQTTKKLIVNKIIRLVFILKALPNSMLFMTSTIISHAYVYSISSAYNIIPVGSWRAGSHVRCSAPAVCSEAAGSPLVSPPSLLSEWSVSAWPPLFREREGEGVNQHQQ